MLQCDLELYYLEDEWMDDFINLCCQYYEMKGLCKFCGLKKSVNVEGFEWLGDYYCVFDDV